jgi:cell fate (sporulation/competence/biofilm development) regulator YlbF (YheA/YmcA/DUF963 family)
MHFTNTIFSSNSNQELDKPNNVIFGNIILETTRQAADLSPDVQRLLESAKKAYDSGDVEQLEKIRDEVKTKYLADYNQYNKELYKHQNPSSSSTGSGDKKEKKSVSDTLIGFGIESATQIGKPERQRFELEKERVKQIALSRGWIKSLDLAEWLRVFFDKYSLKEEIVYKLLNVAHNASVKSGVDTQTVLSLWSSMYGVFPDTDKIVVIINTAADLQSKYRSYRLFDVLRSMAMYPKNNVRYDGEFDNETDNLIWQELKSLVLRAPLEDNSYLSAQWLDSENKLAKALEKAERLQQIAAQMDSIGNNPAAARLINRITGLQRFFQTQSWFKAAQDVIYSIYAGNKAWQVFSAPLSNVSPSIDTLTNEEQYRMKSQPTSFESARQTGSSSLYRNVLAQTKKPTPTEIKFEDVKNQLIRGLQTVLSLPTLAKSSNTNVQFIIKILNVLIGILQNAKLIDLANGTLVNSISTNIESLSSNISNKSSSASSRNKFVKVSQFDLSQIDFSAAGIVSSIASVGIAIALLKYFSDNIVAFANNPEELIKQLSLVSNYIFNVFKREVFDEIYGSPLVTDSLFKDSKGNPNQQALSDFEKAVLQITGSNADAQAITKLDSVITRKLKAIDELETAVNSQIERDVQAGSESKTIRAPADSSGKLAQSIDSLNRLIAEAINDSIVLISLYDRILENKDKQGIDPINISFIGNGRRRARINEERLRSKRQRYASLSVIKDQIARFIRLNMLLGPIMARIKKFNNLGMSTASLISGSKSNPESLLKMMNEIRKNEQIKIDKVQKKISEIKSRVADAESYTDSKYVGI